MEAEREFDFLEGQWDGVCRVPTEKPDSFKTWAKRLLSAARRTLKLDHDVYAYVGPEAQALKAKGVVFTAL